jgi:hypothetical protein
MPVIPAFRRLRQEDCEFKASLGCIARPCPGRKEGRKQGGGKEVGREEGGQAGMEEEKEGSKRDRQGLAPSYRAHKWQGRGRVEHAPRWQLQEIPKLLFGKKPLTSSP